MEQQICLSNRHVTTSQVVPSAKILNRAAPPEVARYGTVPRQPRRASVMLPVSRLQPAESPRLTGPDEEHIHLLAAVGAQLPPILVHRPTMKVIDGMHRLQATILRGEDSIAVEFFEGTEDELFLRAVQANVEHGLPLTRADREAAVVRIIASHPRLSDRAVAAVVGLSAPTVGVIRRRTIRETEQVTIRLGRDGRLRPVNSAEGRRKAAEAIQARPDVSLREIAREAGISPATVRDVRERIRRGEDPVPAGPTRSRPATAPLSSQNGRAAAAARPMTAPVPEYGAAVENLRKDPSLRFNENGRTLLQWLGIHMVGAENHAAFVAAVPPHCTRIMAELARGSAEIWSQLAEQLERRAREVG